MAKVGDGEARPDVRLPLHARRPAGEHDPVHGAPQQAVGPVRQQVADVDEDGRGRVVLGARRDDGDGRPGLAVAEEDLEARLAAQAEEEGQRAVVGVRAGADVLGGGGGGGGAAFGEVGARRVAEEAQDRAGGAALAEVRRGEEGGRVDLRTG